MPVAGRGRILVWEGASLWVLEGAGDHAQTDFHAHHAIQITRDLRGVEIQQIRIHVIRCVVTRHFQIVEHYRGQAVDELRIVFPDFLSQFYGSLNLWD